MSDPDRFVLELLSPIIIASADSPCVSSILSSSHDSRVTHCLSFSVSLSAFICLSSGLTLIKFSSHSASSLSKSAFPPCLSFCLSWVSWLLSSASIKESGYLGFSYIIPVIFYKSLFTFLFIFTCLPFLSFLSLSTHFQSSLQTTLKNLSPHLHFENACFIFLSSWISFYLSSLLSASAPFSVFVPLSPCRTLPVFVVSHSFLTLSLDISPSLLSVFFSHDAFPTSISPVCLTCLFAPSLACLFFFLTRFRSVMPHLLLSACPSASLTCP